MRKRTSKAAKKIKSAKPKRQPYICMRCERQFPSRKALKMHSKAHLQALREMRMLEEGHIPLETKMGSEFKGKNKIIVS